MKAGTVFKLLDLISYESGKISQIEILKNEKMKLLLMAFDESCFLSEHRAPGEAIVFALEGRAEIQYNGTHHTIKENEQFHFAKGDLHAIKAKGKFKMLLILDLSLS